MQPTRSWRRTVLAIAMSGGLLIPAAHAAENASTSEVAALRAELTRIAARLAELEKRNQVLEKSLSAERLSEEEPEIATRLKAVEFQTLAMQKQARQIESLEGISASASLVSVAQRVNRKAIAADSDDSSRSRINYRGDIAVTLPGGEIGMSEGKIFTHFRFGQGNGLGLRPTYTSTINSTAFEVESAPKSDSFGILAQAWYQLSVPMLSEDGQKANAREHAHFIVGKIDPFVFFDQNSIADDESTRFVNNAFVHNPLLDSGGDAGVDSYGFAPGVIASYQNSVNKGEEWGAALGIFAGGHGTDFSGSPGKPFVIAQLHRAARFNYLPGNYRVYAWRNAHTTDYDDDNTARTHAGAGFSVDQKVSDDLTFFSRYGHAFKGKGKFDRALTLGMEWTGGDWGRAADALGLAIGALRSGKDYRTASNLAIENGESTGSRIGKWEQLAELYYRFKVNNHLELSPHLQWIRQPGGESDAPAIRVVGLRARLGF